MCKKYLTQCKYFYTICRVNKTRLEKKTVNSITFAFSRQYLEQTMAITPMFNQLATQIKISALWIVVLFNMTFRDFHEFARTGYIEELLAMTSNGAQVSQGLLLVSAIVLQIPIGMIFLTYVLSLKSSRWANIIGAVVMIVSTVSVNLTPDLDDAFFYSVACAAMVAIIWYAWNWSEPVGN